MLDPGFPRRERGLSRGKKGCPGVWRRPCVSRCRFLQDGLDPSSFCPPAAAGPHGDEGNRLVPSSGCCRGEEVVCVEGACGPEPLGMRGPFPFLGLRFLLRVGTWGDKEALTLTPELLPSASLAFLLLFLGNLFCVGHSAKHFTCSVSFHTHPAPKQDEVLSPVYKKGKQ